MAQSAHGTYVLIPIPSITSGYGRDYGFSNGGGSIPCFSMNFDPAVTAWLLQHVFEPGVRPEHFIVGVKAPHDGLIEVTLFCIIELDANVPLPDQVKQYCMAAGANQPGRTKLIIGTQADIDAAYLGPLCEDIRRHSRYFLVCSNHPPLPQGTPFIRSWSVTLTELLGPEVEQVLVERTSQFIGQ